MDSYRFLEWCEKQLLPIVEGHSFDMVFIIDNAP